MEATLIPLFHPRSPLPITAGAEDINTQTECQRKTEGLWLICTVTGIYVLIASWLPEGLPEGTFAKTEYSENNLTDCYMYTSGSKRNYFHKNKVIIL